MARAAETKPPPIGQEAVPVAPGPSSKGAIQPSAVATSPTIDDCTGAAAKLGDAAQAQKLLDACGAAQAGGTVAVGPAPSGSTSLMVTSSATMTYTTTCPSSPDVSSSDQILHVYYTTVASVAAGNEFRVTSTNLTGLQAPFAATIPDTVAYVLQCVDASCTSGQIVHIHDDVSYPTDRSSSAHFTPTTTGYYRGMVVAYGAGYEGYADIVVQNGTSSYTNGGQVFAGYRVPYLEARAGDALVVGKKNNTNTAASLPIGMPGHPQYADSTLILLSNPYASCPSGVCGTFRFNDDAWSFPTGWVGLSRLLVPTTDTTDWSTPIVIVGTYDNVDGTNGPWRINGRYMHVRRHSTQGGNWNCTESLDNDLDGLPHEVEVAVGSCDLLTDAPAAGAGIVGKNCALFGNLINAQVNLLTNSSQCPVPPTSPFGAPPACWSAVDTDNDGLRDDWEIATGAVHCSADPSASPFGAAGTCTPFGLLQTSNWCTEIGYGSCWGNNVSALGDVDAPEGGPDAAVYDLFVQSDYFNCTGLYCDGDYGTGNPKNSATSVTQRGWLGPVWTNDPLTCWDGTAFPCANPIDPFDNTKDIPYRAKMHYWDGRPANYGDTHSKEVGLDGFAGDASWFDSWNSPLKYMGVAHQALATYYGGGQTGDGTGQTVWGNPTADPNALVRTMSHEIGHQLTLQHPHDNKSDIDNAGASGKCQAQCTTSGCACKGCDGVCLADGEESDNPGAPSIMSYDWELWSGMQPKTGTLPPAAALNQLAAGCDTRNLRFSKGLGRPLYEAALPEVLAQTAQTIKLAQDLSCYAFVNKSGCTPNPYARPNLPFCDGSNCSFDWNRDNSISGTWQIDLTAGAFFGNACNNDYLVDWDEWRTIFTQGRKIRKPPATGQDFLSKSYTNFAIFATPFNGLATVWNTAGWTASQLPIDSNVAVTSVAMAEYERNVCDSNTASSCASGVCVYDAASTACSVDSQCRSHWCSGGTCVTTRGACQCGTDPQCNFLPAEFQRCNNARNSCYSNRQADVVPLNSPNFQPRESAWLGGSADPRWIHLHSTGTASPLAAIDLQDAAELNLDFRWEGGALPQTLINNGGFSLQLLSVGGGPRLRLTHKVANITVDSLAFIDQHRWYRVKAAVTQSDDWLDIQAMDLLTTLYDGFPAALSGCRWKTGAAVAATGDVWFGVDDSGHGSAFNGRIDNLALYDYVPKPYRPATCVQLP